MSLHEYFALWPLFQNATLSGTFLGLALGVLGVHIVLRRMVFLTAAISQTASLGVVLAVFIAGTTGALAVVLTPTTGAFIMTLLTLGIVQMGRTAKGDMTDALLGALYLLGAAGTLVLSAQVQMELQELHTMLFGTAVAVLQTDFVTIIALSIVVVVVQGWAWRGFVSATLDPADARVRGIPVRVLDGLLLLSVAVLIAVGTRVLGPLPTFAFSVLPSFAALRISKNVPEALILGGVIGALMGFGGYIAATLGDLSVGASQALVGVGMVILAELLGRLRRAWMRSWRVSLRV